jgi:hypothetical protein
MIKNDARCAFEIKPKIALAKTALNRKETMLTVKPINALIEDLFVLSDKHNNIYIVCEFYSTLLHVSAVNFSHYQVRHSFT